MSVVIDQELINFKTKVEPSLGNMNSTKSLLVSKLTNLSNTATSVKSSIDNVYNSENKASILSKFDDINSVYVKISSSVEGDLGNILGKAESLISLVSQLETLRNEIAKDEYIVGHADNYKASEVSAARASVSNNTSQFNSKHQEALTALSTLKGMDASLGFTSSSSTSTASGSYNNGQIVGRTFERRTFVSSKGVKMDYYIYIPKYATDVKKLPVHVYLHGGGGTGGVKYSLPKMINKGLDVNGIVISPLSTSGQWLNEDLEDAVVELTQQVVESYDADSNRISLSGHSNGANGGYRILSRYPDYFSAFVPISGQPKYMVTAKDPNRWTDIKDVQIWAFHSKNDSFIGYKYPLSILEQTKEEGLDNFELHTFNSAGHDIYYKVFGEKFEKNGKEWSVLDWCFAQSKSNT